MKITIISRHFPSALKHYERRLERELVTYNERLNGIINQLGENHSFIKKELEKRGYTVQFIISNWEEGQALWSKENNLHGISNHQSIYEQILHFNPQIIYTASYFELFGTLLPEIKEKLNIKIIAWTSCPIPSTANLRVIDKFFTGLPTYVKKFKEIGVEAEETTVGFPLAWKSNNQEKNIDVGFIGAVNGLFTKEKFHNYRTELLIHLSKKMTIDKWGYGYLSNSKVKSIFKYALQDKNLFKNYHGELWGYEMLDKLASFKIGLNCHGEIAEEYAVNYRIFETTGVGTMLLTDEKKYLSKYFEADKEVVTYSSADDCLDKINYLLAHPLEIERIAKAGQQRTLSDYTLEKYVDKIEHSF